MRILVIILITLWTILCLPLAIPVFYIKESYNLAELFSLKIEEILKKYR